MRRDRNAKIIATLGPASATPEAIRGLFETGADVFRLNCSHSSQTELASRIAVIRDLERASGRPIAIVLDLQGPKLRVGRLGGGQATLAKDEPFRLDLDETPGDGTRAPLPHPEVFAALAPGTVLTSMVKRVDNALFQCVRGVHDGSFRSGILEYGLAEDGVGYAVDEHNRPIVDEATIARVEELRAGIVSGAIEVPSGR